MRVQRPQKQRRVRGGNIAIIMLVSIMGILAFAGLAIDWTYVRTTEFELKNAADAAAHAALLELRRSGDVSAARELAIDIAALNTAGGKSVTLTDESIAFGQWSYGDNSFTEAGSRVNGVRVRAGRVEGSADGPVKLFIGPLFGYNGAAVAETAVGAYRSRDIMISVDISTSMIEEMNDAVKAMSGFASNMELRALPNDRVGLNVFKSSATNITNLIDVEGNISKIKSDWDGDGKANTDKKKTSGVTNCYVTTCKPGIPGCTGTKNYNIPGAWMPQCSTMSPDGNFGGSNQGAGLLAARETLTSNDDRDNTQVIVFISDGRPSCPAGSACVAARSKYAVQQADAAAAAGINIFTISLNSTKSTAQTAFMASLVRGYGKAYETPDSADLQEILAEIEAEIPIALVE